MLSGHSLRASRLLSVDPMPRNSSTSATTPDLRGTIVALQGSEALYLISGQCAYQLECEASTLTPMESLLGIDNGSPDQRRGNRAGGRILALLCASETSGPVWGD